MTDQVAVLGLGRMGRALAGRLLAAGHPVTVWNRTPGRAGELVGRGAVEAASVGDAVAGAAIVLSSLTGDDALRAVVLPDGEPVAALTGVLVECSTVAPATSRQLAGHYPDRLLACPIAGAPAAVAAGRALLLVAGAAGALERADAVLGAISGNRLELGEDPGRAALLKLLNNYLLLSEVALLADVTSTARAAGFAPEELTRLLPQLPVVAPGVAPRVAGLVGHDHDPQFSVELAIKDLTLATAEADAAGSALELAGPILELYRRTVALGLGGRDVTAAVEALTPE